MTGNEEHTIAVFFDFENLALGLKKQTGPIKMKFDVQLILERLVEKGKIVVKKAYADWSSYADYKGRLHEAAIELIEIPRRRITGKNSADIRLCVDAMDLSYSKEHIDTFVIVSGDSDFSPLVSKLKENGKTVIGLGIKESTSDLLSENCDEFVFYDDLTSAAASPPLMDSKIPPKKREVMQLMLDSIAALMRENKTILWASMVKTTMKRKKTSFNEAYYGYRSFSELLEYAQKEGLIHLRTDSRSGTYVVVGFGSK